MGSTPKQTDLFGAPPQADTGATERRVFDLWVEATGRRKGSTLLDTRRQARIRWALAHYPIADVEDAVRGAGASQWHRERRHDDLTLVLRDAAHLERFRDQWRKRHPAPALPAVPQYPPDHELYGVPLDDPWWYTYEGTLAARKWLVDPAWCEWARDTIAEAEQRAREERARAEAAPYDKADIVLQERKEGERP